QVTEDNEVSQVPANAAVKTATSNAFKAAGEATKKVAGKAIMKIGAFIMANPWILLIIGILVLLILLIVILVGGSTIINNSSTAYLDDCSAISISTTSLSQSEFVDKVQDYFAGSSNPDEITFSQNASK